MRFGNARRFALRTILQGRAFRVRPPKIERGEMQSRFSAFSVGCVFKQKEGKASVGRPSFGGRRTAAARSKVRGPVVERGHCASASRATAICNARRRRGGESPVAWRCRLRQSTALTRAILSSNSRSWLPRVIGGAEPARPNPSLERTRNGMALCPRGAHCYPAPRGHSAMPPRAAQLKR